VGGVGPKRTPALAAKFAAEFNVPFMPPDVTKASYDRVRTVLADAGRPEDSLTYSAAYVVCAGRDDAQVATRAAAIGREVDELRASSPLAGTPAEIVDKLGPFVEVGVQRVYLQLLDMSDLDHLELIATEVVPQLG
jgi:alkanesulfonate monooxygenase SsuD/methylene tetrahydromethanopterin reductase-like flavin-dependent oxidoreductase (luciferase family)